MKKGLQQLFDEFIQECEFSAKLSPETLRGYRASFGLFSKLMPDMYLETIGPKTITEFFRRMETRERVIGKGSVKKGVTKSTIATYWSKLNRFMKWLVKNGHIKKNPFDDLGFPRVCYEDKKYLKKEEIEKIFSALTFNVQWNNQLVQKRNIAIFSLLLCCGLRKGELLGLKVYDLDFERKQVLVRAEISKSKINRTIPLNSLALSKLTDYQNERRKQGYKTEYLFVSNNTDDKFTAHGLKHLIQKLNTHSGVRFHAHQFRHTFAVNLLNNECDIAKLKQLLGHRDIRMTATYVRCLPTKMMRQDVETLRLDNLV